VGRSDVLAVRFQIFTGKIHQDGHSAHSLSSTDSDGWGARTRISRGRAYPLDGHCEAENGPSDLAGTELRIHSVGIGVRQLLRLPGFPKPENARRNLRSECRDISLADDLQRPDEPTRPVPPQSYWV
jgi:hypothetical protein